jgi:hypothetical protein
MELRDPFSRGSLSTIIKVTFGKNGAAEIGLAVVHDADCASKKATWERVL